MFKILDRYIIRTFLGTYVFAIVLLLAIVVMFDVNEKLDAFLKAPLQATIMDYYESFTRQLYRVSHTMLWAVMRERSCLFSSKLSSENFAPVLVMLS